MLAAASTYFTNKISHKYNTPKIPQMQTKDQSVNCAECNKQTVLAINQLFNAGISFQHNEAPDAGIYQLTEPMLLPYLPPNSGALNQQYTVYLDTQSETNLLVISPNSDNMPMTDIRMILLKKDLQQINIEYQNNFQVLVNNHCHFSMLGALTTTLASSELAELDNICKQGIGKYVFAFWFN